MKRRSVALVLTVMFMACGCFAARDAKESPDVHIEVPLTAAATQAPTPEASLPLAVTATPFVVEETPLPSATPEPTQTSASQAERVPLNDDFYYVPLDDATRARITGLSYPQNDSDAAVNYSNLRYIHLLHVDFEGNVREGELIVNKKVAQEVMEIFYGLYQAKYPLTSVVLVDEFGEAADDNLSMAANNTSAFNYRVVAGSKTLSLHSYGLAVDINPLLNPYVKSDGGISPESGAEYADRTRDFVGKIDHDDLCYQLFTEHGWTWGGDWKNSKDYQHFSKDVR